MLADALTKDNRETAALLNKVLREGIHSYHPDTIDRITPKEDVLETDHDIAHKEHALATCHDINP